MCYQKIHSLVLNSFKPIYGQSDIVPKFQAVKSVRNLNLSLENQKVNESVGEVVIKEIHTEGDNE